MPIGQVLVAHEKKCEEGRVDAHAPFLGKEIRFWTLHTSHFFSMQLTLHLMPAVMCVLGIVRPESKSRDL